MANTKNKETMAYKNKINYIREYNKKKIKLYMELNPKTESDIIQWLNGRRKATYIKQLIREDMKNNQ